ncbi:MAG: response regulator, partial [Cyanobacteria bacterium P01_D01_bin.2]
MTTILVIDDDTNLGTVFCETLALNGFSTLRATTGHAGIQLTRRHHPQLVVCDIGLPDISGHSVLKGVRSHPATTTIPVIMLTGRTDADTFRHSMEHGADDYLTKPVDLGGFLRAVQTQLAKRKQLAEHFASTSADPTEPAPISLEDLEARLEASAPPPQLWMIQLRNYGAIQARYGHIFGQLVLQSVGQQLQQWRSRCHGPALPIETYRIDERFVILLSAPPGLVDQAIASLQTRLKQPRVVSNHRLSLDICVRSVSCLDLAAHKPLEGMASSTQPSERLRRAIQRDELQLYFQPQVDLNSGQIIGAEALVRWIVPGEPPILPGQFIPVAEDSGLMPSLGDW